MLLSKSGPTDIRPYPLLVVRLYDRTPIPAKWGAAGSATPTRCSIEMLRQISSAVKLRCAKLGAGSRAWSMIRKSVQRFSEKIMLKQKDRAG